MLYTNRHTKMIHGIKLIFQPFAAITFHLVAVLNLGIDGFRLACERRRISGCRSSPPKNNVCKPEPGNDFSDVGILSQSQFSSSSPRPTARGIRCEEHSSFILSWNLIGQGETKVITSQQSFPGSGSQTLFFGGDERQPEIRLRSQASFQPISSD